MKIWGWAIVGLASAGASGAQTTPTDGASSPVTPVGIPTGLPTTTPPTLVAGTPVTVMTNEEISTNPCKVGASFGVTVVRDVTSLGVVVIPAGAIGSGEITFCTNKGGFGKPGILGIALRQLDLNGKKIALDGRYREEGRNNNGATAATWFAVGVFSGFIKGRAGVIPKGRELRARTGEDIAFNAGAVSPPTVIPVPLPPNQIATPAPAVPSANPPQLDNQNKVPSPSSKQN